MTTPSPEAIEAATWALLEWDHDTADRTPGDETVAEYRRYALSALAAAYAVDMPTALKNAAKDVYLWAHAMTTQQAMTAATFAADRILELAGIDGDEADEVAREAHAEWTARIARQEQP